MREPPVSLGLGKQGLAQQRHPAAGSRGRVGWDAGRPGQAGPCEESSNRVKGKCRLVLCKLKYSDTRIARVVYREKL